MTWEFRSNGRIELRLDPGDPIESAYIARFRLAAEKGESVKVEAPEDGGVILAVEK